VVVVVVVVVAKLDLENIAVLQPSRDPGLRQSRGLHQLPEHACCWNLAAATWEKRAALGYRSASGAGEEVFGDGSDRLALDLGL
jgi:hypothetical protein